MATGLCGKQEGSASDLPRSNKSSFVRYRTDACAREYAHWLLHHNGRKSGDAYMLETIAIVLLILWALGLVSSYTLGGFIHLLLVAVIVVVLIRVLQGRRI